MNFKSILLLVAIFSQSAFAQGGGSGHVGGGGDDSERRVDEIRADLVKWISAGGARALNLPASLSFEDYETRMTEILQPKLVIVTFTDEVVKVNGKAKTCRGEKSDAGEYSILCNLKRFNETAEGDQYPLIHHEYAGLAGVEQNLGAASDYDISKQLTGFLEVRPGLKLVVKPALPPVRKECEIAVFESRSTYEKDGFKIERDENGKESPVYHWEYKQTVERTDLSQAEILTLAQKGYRFVPSTKKQKTNAVLSLFLDDHFWTYINGNTGAWEVQHDIYALTLSRQDIGFSKRVAPKDTWQAIQAKGDPQRSVDAGRLAQCSTIADYQRVQAENSLHIYHDQAFVSQLTRALTDLPTCTEVYGY